MSKIVAVIGALFLINGLFLSGFGFATYQGQKSQLDKGKEVEVNIESVKVQRNVTEIEDVDTRHRGRRMPDMDTETRTVVNYRPVVKYNYTVDGETYESSSVFPGSEIGKSDKKWAEKIASNYKEGEEDTGYYVPSNPDKSYLRTQASVLPLFLGGIGLVIVLVGLAAIWKGFKS